MVVRGVELVMSRRQIDAMIRSDPVLVQFIRRVKVVAPGGGWRWADPEEPLRPQQVRLLPFKRRMSDPVINTELGPVTNLPYTLLGRHTLDIQQNDLFDLGGARFEVKFLDISEPEVKVAAGVDYFGVNDG